MNPFLDAAMTVIKTVFLNPESDIKMVVVAGGTVLIVGFLLGVIASTCGAKVSSVGTGFMTTLLVGVILIAAAAAGLAYLAPMVGKGTTIQLTVAGGTALVALLALGIPLTMFFFRGGYLSALLTWVIGGVVAILIIFCLSYGFNAIRDGAQSFQNIEKRKEKLEQEQAP
ncbi:MAG: hypothetical protein SFY92_06875 [Verrucomicrobiae bacterium]|nr:hypothetical protein [Verrucomicrobiae bacterium]